jgi:hypothetical protein
LHARALLGDDEFTSSEIAVGFGQKNRDLKRKHEVSVKVLMETIKVTLHVL